MDEREGFLRVKRSQLLMAMSRACDLGEAKPLGHGWRTTKRALGLVSRGALEGRQWEVAVGGLLHDVGMSSVTYELYERIGGRERSLLAGYPALNSADPLTGLMGDADGGAVRFILERHAEVGAGMVRVLGYGEGVAKLVEGHQRLDGDVWEQALAVSDRVETALGQGRGAAWVWERVGLLEAGGLSREVTELVRDMLAMEEAQGGSHVNEGAFEAELDGLFEAGFGVWADEGEVERHLRLLAQVVDAQSPFMAGHTLDVTRLGRRMGEHLGLDSQLLDHLSLAGLAHGVGRLGLPASILEKSGGLSEDEFETLHTYPHLTREALRPIEALRPLVDAASTHREKLDGSGYPEGRRDAEIPLIGRILAVADTYNALICDRPYRSGYGRGRALAILRAEGTRLFDGVVLDALEAVCREGL
jgi:HD-GYP domain-containing protein (c-di-GMP phosphodiesterase class II)